jgi:hypothetical protein
VLTFHLVGINNQNFVMQDTQTGTWWQQVSGEAILGPLKGRQLTLVPFDHLTFARGATRRRKGACWRPDARVAAANRYAAPIGKSGCRRRRRLNPRRRLAAAAARARARRRGRPRRPRVSAGGPSALRVVLDTLGGTPIAIVRGPDGRSTRVFDRGVDGRALELFAKIDASPFRMVDTRRAANGISRASPSPAR